MSKLYEVEITIRAVVVADDRHFAQEVLDDQLREILRSEDFPDATVGREIKCFDDLPDGWSLPCLPYGDHDDKSIAQYLSDLPPSESTPDTKTTDMFASQV